MSNRSIFFGTFCAVVSEVQPKAILLLDWSGEILTAIITIDAVQIARQSISLANIDQTPHPASLAACLAGEMIYGYLPKEPKK